MRPRAKRIWLFSGRTVASDDVPRCFGDRSLRYARNTSVIGTLAYFRDYIMAEVSPQENEPAVYVYE